MSDSSLSVESITEPVISEPEDNRQDRAPGRPVLRFEGPECFAQIHDHREQWLQSLRATPSATLDLHPDLLAPLCTEANSGMLVLSSESGDADPKMQFAALAAQQIRMRILTRPNLCIRFRGHRLIGNEIAGCAAAKDRTPFVQAIFDLLSRRQSECIMLDDLELASSMHDAILSAARLDRRVTVHQPSGAQARWWIDFPPDPAGYWKKFSKKTREGFRAKVRKLDHEFLKFTAHDQVPAFLQMAHEISKTSWQTKRMGLRIANTPESERFWKILARIGAFRSYVLRHAGRPIAFMVGRQWNGRFYYEEAGYDVEFSRQSPGTVLQIRVLEDLISRDTPRLFDFSFGDGDHKRLFGNRQTNNAAILVLPRTWKNSAGVAIQRAATGIMGSLRSSRLYKHFRRSHHG